MNVWVVQCITNGLKGSKEAGHHQSQTILVQDGQQFRLTTNISVFFYCKGIVCNGFLSRDETINRFRYLEIFENISVIFPSLPTHQIWPQQTSFFSFKNEKAREKGSFDDFETIKKKKSLKGLKSILVEDFRGALLLWKRR